MVNKNMSKTEFKEAVALLADAMKTRVSQTKLGIGEATVLLLERNEPINRKTLIAELKAMLSDKPNQGKKHYLNAALEHLIC